MRSKPSPASEDVEMQSAVLSLVLTEHPIQMTRAELVRDLSKNPDDFAERDAVERAVADLVGVGLLRCQSEAVAPTRAALAFDRLDRS
jgi:hypothetical protein